MGHHGHLTTRELRDRGISERALARMLGDGSLRRVRRGWYATQGADPDVGVAIRAGGSLTCVSALRKLGVWVLPDARLHVAVGRGAVVRADPSIVLHWQRERSSAVVHTAADSLGWALRCLSTRDAVVVADSAVHGQVLAEEEVIAICGGSARGRKVAALLDPAAESGLETIARLALRSRRVSLRSQVQIAGIGRVDLLIGDRLVLELDGREWHDRPGDFERDRARDRALVAAGYVVMRVSYRQVMTEWPRIEAQILALVRRREHLWRAPHASLGHVPRGYRG